MVRGGHRCSRFEQVRPTSRFNGLDSFDAHRIRGDPAARSLRPSQESQRLRILRSVPPPAVFPPLPRSTNSTQLRGAPALQLSRKNGEPSDAACSVGQVCNGAETCDALNGCEAGTPPDCNDGVTCTLDACNEANDSCDHLPNNAACSDGQFCNGAEVCDVLNGCQAGIAPDCSDGVGCTVDSCNEATDMCNHVPNNAACSDGQFCNGAET